MKINLEVPFLFAIFVSKNKKNNYENSKTF